MLEDDLKAALRPVEPPEGFEQRVMARLDSGGGSMHRPVRTFSAWAAAAGLAFASVAGIAVYNKQQEQRRGLEARDQLILALQITGKKLDAVRKQINNSNHEAQQQ
jgi:hypothetical protein